MIDFIYNPINDKTPLGVSQVGQKVKFNIKVSKFRSIGGVDFVLHKDGEGDKHFPMILDFVDEKYMHYSITRAFTSSGHHWYHFEAKCEDSSIKLIQGNRLDIRESDDDSDYLQLVIEKESKVSPSFRDGIIYHIFVDRFCRVGTPPVREGLTLVDKWDTPVDYEYDSKGERVNHLVYGGNLDGIISKLDYLESLGVTSIYLSPIFEAHSSHKYNTADYSKIDDMFGGEVAFKKLLSETKKRGMNIILDGVFNHTGSDSVYFNKEGRYPNLGAYQSKDSPYYDWFEFQSFPDNYSTWWGIPTLPKTVEKSGFGDYIAGKGGIIEKYLKMGVAGFRLDVVDELSNKFISTVHNTIKSVNSEAIIIGEVWEAAASKVAYSERKEYFLGSALDSVTNYPVKNAIIDFVKYGDTEHFVSIIRTIKDRYPRSIQNNLMNILGSHDTVRIFSKLISPDNKGEIKTHVIGDEERKRGIPYLKMASLMQYTVLGIPTVYYGDEIGMTGGRDPFCRETYPWGEEDTEILEWYRFLGRLRKEYEVLREGELNILYAEDSAILYERFTFDDRLYIGINRGKDDFKITLGHNYYDIISGEIKSGEVVLKENEFVILEEMQSRLDRLVKLKAEQDKLSLLKGVKRDTRVSSKVSKEKKDSIEPSKKTGTTRTTTKSKSTKTETTKTKSASTKTNTTSKTNVAKKKANS